MAVTQSAERLTAQARRLLPAEPAPPPAEGEEARPPRPAPDGYVRRSPVQPMAVAAGYHRRRRRRALGLAAAAGLLLGAVWLLLNSGLPAF